MEIESTDHQDVAEPDQMVSGMAGTGQENEELAWAKRHIREEASPRLVDRKTEIIGCGVPVNKKKKILPLTEEEALRKRIRTIMDEQDRMQEDMFLRWNGLRHRIEDLEDEVEALKSRGTAKDQEVPE